MTFIAEDGTGLPDANSFVNVEFANAYFALRNVTAWQGTDQEKQAWLVQATDYISARFNFKGLPLKEDQGLPFPRMGEIAGLPVNLLKATCEYAIRAKDAPLAPDPVIDESGWAVTSMTEKVGPIEDSKSFASGVAGASLTLFRPYPAADILLKGLLQSAGRRVIRA
jgi:hypothetical protein